MGGLKHLPSLILWRYRDAINKGMSGMSAKRGYRRLAIAVVGSWLAVWASIGAFAVWQQSVWTRLFIEASRSDRAAEANYANEYGLYYGKLIAKSLAWGAFAIPLTLAFALGWWVYRGYKPAE